DRGGIAHGSSLNGSGTGVPFGKTSESVRAGLGVDETRDGIPGPRVGPSGELYTSRNRNKRSANGSLTGPPPPPIRPSQLTTRLCCKARFGMRRLASWLTRTSVNAVFQQAGGIQTVEAARGRLADVSWAQIVQDLDSYGAATLTHLLASEECKELV